MYFDLLLLSVVMVTAYLGPTILRRQPRGQRAFAWLLVADGAAALLALVAPPGRGAETLGFVAIGAAVCLLVVPPILRDLARRALRADRPALALRLVSLWDHLQPGMGVSRERDLIEVLVAVRNGRVDDAVAVLREARAELREPRAQRHMDERIVATYLTARRWRDAIHVYEASMERAGEPPPAQLCVELVWAYCEIGELEAAGRLVDRIAAAPVPLPEGLSGVPAGAPDGVPGGVPAGAPDGAPGAEPRAMPRTLPRALIDPLWTFLVQRARLMFLAFVGRTTAVEGMVAPEGPLHMLPEASRQFWSGVARLNAGDRGGARAALQQAARLARGDRRAREVAEQVIARIDVPGVAGPHAISDSVTAMAERFSAEAMAAPPVPVRSTPQLAGVPLRRLPVTVGLIAANALAFLAVLALFGSTGDPGGLVRAGANVKTWVLGHGQLWRLPSSLFLHVGLVHLVLNMYGLWILGKLVEQMHGPVRMFAIYMLAGLAGAFASAWFGAPGLSAGASGAVLGLLGALIAELGLHRQAYPRRWRSALLAPLVFVAAAQVVIGFFYPAIDQWAHVAGLVVGAGGAGLLSRQSAWGKSMPVRLAAVILALAGVASLGYGAYGVATSRHRDVLATAPRAVHTLGGLQLTVPATLRLESGALVDDVSLGLESAACPVSGAERPSELCAPGGAPGEAPGEAPGGSNEANVDRAVGRAVDHAIRVVLAAWPGARAGASRPIELPAPWQGQEIEIAHEGLGGVERYRVIVAGRVHGEAIWVVAAQMPEALAGDVMPTLVEILTSASPAGTAEAAPPSSPASPSGPSRASEPGAGG
jgi:membrane associated rhomboid family serine protease